MSYRRGQVQNRQYRMLKPNELTSLSTQGSSSSRQTSKAPRNIGNKEKLELCRKFMEIGCCPYNNKCKFAHGSHQLRRNQSLNVRYKTKECGTFFKYGSCNYGDRCNFLHVRKNKLNQVSQNIIWSNFRQLFYELRPSSKILSLLFQKL